MCDLAASGGVKYKDAAAIIASADVVAARCGAHAAAAAAGRAHTAAGDLQAMASLLPNAYNCHRI